MSSAVLWRREGRVSDAREAVVCSPLRWERQFDGRNGFWGAVADLDGRYLRVVLLDDGRTIHNAFPDRGFVP
jgi:hypothetical protein